MNNILSFGDFGIFHRLSMRVAIFADFFAVLRYLSIFSAILRCSAPPNVPFSEHSEPGLPMLKP